MKNIFFLLALVFVSCARTEDDSNSVCTGDCTIFNGQIKTADNVGIPNVTLKLKYYIGSELGSYTRILGKVKTDKDGYYYMPVFVRDKEIGDSSPGYFSLILDTDNIDKTVSGDYLKPKEVLDVSYEDTKPAIVINSITQRNLTFANDFVVPRRGNVRVKLNNFKPVIEGDFFQAIVQYNYTCLCNGNWTTYGEYEGDSGYATSNPTIIDKKVILGCDITVLINRKKNGVIQNEEKTFVLDNPNIYELNFDY